MKLELKNLKTHEDMSEETLCFSATLYVDGKKAAVVSNCGQGGCNRYVWADWMAGKSKLEIKLFEYCNSLPQRSFPSEVTKGETITYSVDLDCLVDELITRADTLKRTKQQMRNRFPFRVKGHTYKPGECSTLATTSVPAATVALDKRYGAGGWRQVTAEQIADEACKEAL